MLPLLEALLRTSSKVKSFHIIDSDPLDEENFLFKIRCELISGQYPPDKAPSSFRQHPIFISGILRQSLAALG